MPTAPNSGRVLVVDDEASIRDALCTALRYEGLLVREADSGRSALACAKDWNPDAVVLDVMLPDIDGIQVCRRLRAAGLDAHVLFLTARDHLANKVTGLGAGGDDYITKPFSLAEIVARIQAVMRRRAMAPLSAASATTGPPAVEEAVWPAAGSLLTCGDLVLDPERHQVWRAGTEVTLTATEFRLLAYLLEASPRVVSKQQILDAVWDEDFSGTPNIVEAYVGYLRRKLDRLGPPMIETIRLVGYVLRDPAAASAPPVPDAGR